MQIYSIKLSTTDAGKCSPHTRDPYYMWYRVVNCFQMKLQSDREMSSLTSTKIKVGNGHCCVLLNCVFSRIFIYLIGEIKAQVLQGLPLSGHMDRNTISTVISLMDSVRGSISLYDDSVSGQ